MLDANQVLKISLRLAILVGRYYRRWLGGGGSARLAYINWMKFRRKLLETVPYWNKNK